MPVVSTFQTAIFLPSKLIVGELHAYVPIALRWSYWTPSCSSAETELNARSTDADALPTGVPQLVPMLFLPTGSPGAACASELEHSAISAMTVLMTCLCMDLLPSASGATQP